MHLDPEVVPLRMVLRQHREILAIAEADLEDAGRAAAEKAIQIERLRLIVQKLQRELANNPAQQKNSQYARDFQSPDAVAKLLAKAKQGVGLLGDGKADDKEVIAQGLSFWVKDGKARKKYIEAFNRITGLEFHP